MQEKKRFKVMIGGKPYTIVGSRTDQHMNAVVELVNNQFNQLSDLAPDLSREERAVLMAVNAISDQLLKEEQIMALEEVLNQKESPSKSTNRRGPVPYRKRS